MFNVFDNQNNMMIEEAKIQFLLKKVNHPKIANTMEELISRITTDLSGITKLTLNENHIV